jgi:hypothetical protein
MSFGRIQFEQKFNLKHCGTCESCPHVWSVEYREPSGYHMGTDIPDGFRTAYTYECTAMAKFRAENGSGRMDWRVSKNDVCDLICVGKDELEEFMQKRESLEPLLEAIRSRSA